MKTVKIEKRGLKHKREPLVDPRPVAPMDEPRCVLFLDLDGVLNFWTRADSLTEGIGDMWTGRCLAPSCVQVFNEMIAELDVPVVVSSSWKDRPEYGGNLEALKATLRDEAGVHVERICDVTPNLGPRLAEIFTWLRYHPEFNRFVILDDNVGGLSSVTEHLVLTQTSTGLVPDDIARAKACLKVPYIRERMG